MNSEYLCKLLFLNNYYPSSKIGRFKKVVTKWRLNDSIAKLPTNLSTAIVDNKAPFILAEIHQARYITALIMQRFSRETVVCSR